MILLIRCSFAKSAEKMTPSPIAPSQITELHALAQSSKLVVERSILKERMADPNKKVKKGQFKRSDTIKPCYYNPDVVLT